ncbi:hypothetical protein CC80DRAFT_85846 [Byssothecium circinans]|uniref:Uncharacterized protein n=1 Tax=Byssothecium circinans TaxID=147558 RepID=A0A6A5TUQ3_9PLEO|nr:hypothetical protein CC80DRAFT_85846 [Byssothecium circinans]
MRGRLPFLHGVPTLQASFCPPGVRAWNIAPISEADVCSEWRKWRQNRNRTDGPQGQARLPSQPCSQPRNTYPKSDSAQDRTMSRHGLDHDALRLLQSRVGSQYTT